MQYFLFGELIWVHGWSFLGSINGYFALILFLLFTLEIAFIFFGGYFEFLLIKFYFLTAYSYFSEHLSSFYFLTLFQILVCDNIFFKSLNYSKKYAVFIVGSVLISCTAYFLYSSSKANLQFQLLSIYPIVYLLLVCVSYVKVSNKFPTPENISQELGYLFRGFRNSFLLITISIIYFIFRTKPLVGGNISLIVLFIILGIAVEWNQFRTASNTEGVERKSAFFLYIIFALIALYSIWLEFLQGREFEYKETAGNLVELYVSFSIFNIASAFILLQSNYQKFGSNYLIVKTIKSPVLIVSICLPLIILFTQMYIYKEGGVEGRLDGRFSSHLVLIDIVCSSVLFIYFKYVLDVSYQLKKLLKSINRKDIELYKKNIIYLSESKIDAVLHVIINVISKNDAASSHSIFYNLSAWVSKNIKVINMQNGNDSFDNQNRFYDFFEIIINNIIALDNNVIHWNFISSIKNMILNSVNSKNFEQYNIIYDRLYLYLEKMIEKKKNELSIEILRTIFYNIDNVFMNLVRMDEDSQFVHTNDDYRKFKNIFIKRYEDIIQKAIENGCNRYLEGASLYDRLYFGSDESSELKSDGKIINLLLETRHSAIKKYEYLIRIDGFWHRVAWEFGVFLPYRSFGERYSKFNKNKLIQNVLFDVLIHLYIYSIEKEKIKSDMDYDIFYMQILSAVDNRDLEIFQIYLNSFTFLINFQFSKELKKEHPNHGILNSIWMRIIQIKKRVNEVKPGFIFTKKINSKIKFLKKKYKEITKYEANPISFRFLKNVDLLNEYDIEIKPNDNKRS